jgi:hypothetical protein
MSTRFAALCQVCNIHRLVSVSVVTYMIITLVLSRLDCGIPSSKEKLANIVVILDQYYDVCPR